MDETEGRLLEPGMILFDPEYGPAKRPQVWTVSRVNKASAVVLAHHETLHIEARLKSNRLHPGWRIINHDPLAAYLKEQLAHDPHEAAREALAANRAAGTATLAVRVGPQMPFTEPLDD